MSINAQLDVAATLDAHSNFLPQGSRTQCNIYAAAFLGLRGHVIPLLSANELYDWFSSPAAVGQGWTRASFDEAMAVANAGGDAVCIRQEKDHGHIGVIVESLPNTPGRMCVSAAGVSNFVRAPIERSFGELEPGDRFFINTGDK